jgi:preprotein translocase subunit SecG
MLSILLQIFLILDSFVLIAAILLQAGKGTGMAASFGGVSSSPDAFIGTRQAGNLLTNITWWASGIFIAIAFVLQVSSAHARAPKSVLEQGLAPPPAAPAQTAPSSAAPALPFQPAPTTPPAGAAPSAGTKPTPGRPGTKTPASSAPAAAKPTGTAPSPK